MPELLTIEVVASVLRDLSAAFPGRLKDADLMRRAQVYHDNLHGFSGESLRWAAKHAIREEEYFPKVSQLRAFAFKWQNANHANGDGAIARPSGWCDSCRTVARPQQRCRPRITEKGQRILDDRGRLWLEPYERVVCLCDAACAYAPDDDGSECMSDGYSTEKSPNAR